MPKQPKKKLHNKTEKPSTINKNLRLISFAKEQQRNIIEAVPGKRYSSRTATQEVSKDNTESITHLHSKTRGSTKPQSEGRSRAQPQHKTERRQLRSRTILQQETTQRTAKKSVKKNNITVENPRYIGQRSPEVRPRNYFTTGQDLVSNWIAHPDTQSLPSHPRSTPEYIIEVDSEALEYATMNLSSTPNDTTESVIDLTEQDRKSQTTQKPPTVSYDQLLRLRGISLQSTRDGGLEHLALKNFSAPPLTLDHAAIASFYRLLKTHLDRVQESMDQKNMLSHYLAFESAKQEITSWVPMPKTFRPFPTVGANDFNLDIKHCMQSGEAEFQRTIMMSLIDRTDFRNIFTYSCEELWNVDPAHVLQPQGPPNKIQQPKPDLAISFQDKAFIDEGRLLPYPLDLSKCLYPGSMSDIKWFPFLFMEAKKGDDSLKKACRRNLHSASQALYNIYQWVDPYDDLSKEFFSKARTFSIDINAEIIVARVHRAERNDNSGLSYHYAQINKVLEYDRLTACHWIKSILVGYAHETLLPLLRTAYQRRAVNNLNDRPGTKRKAEATNGGSRPRSRNKRASNEQDNEPQNETLHTGNSFMLKNIEIEEHTQRLNTFSDHPDRGYPSVCISV